MRCYRRLSLLVFLGSTLGSPLPSYGQAQETKKDIPTISREALKAVVLIVVSGSDGMNPAWANSTRARKSSSKEAS